MTISTETRKAGPFVGNGVTTVFPFAFKVFTKADLEVKLNITATGVISTLVVDADYTVALNADQNTNPGGTVTYTGGGTPLPATKTLTIGSIVTNTQGTDITNGGGFFPNVIEDMADRNTIEVQQLALKVSNSLRAPIVDAAALNDLPPVAQRALLFLSFDAAGQPLASVGTGTPTSAYGATLVVAANAGAALTVLGVTAYAQTLTAAANAAAARTVLGLGTADAVTHASLVLTSTLSMAGDFDINSSKFHVTAASGDVSTAGKITVTAAGGVITNAAVTSGWQHGEGAGVRRITYTVGTTTFNLITDANTSANLAAGALTASSINFGQTTLNYYGQGSWTPIDSSGAALSLAVASGTYTRVGNKVTTTFRVVYPATGSGATMTIGGLPFTSNADANPGGGVLNYNSAGGLAVLGLYVNTSATTWAIRLTTNATPTNATLSSDDIRGVLTYLM